MTSHKELPEAEAAIGEVVNSSLRAHASRRRRCWLSLGLIVYLAAPWPSAQEISVVPESGWYETIDASNLQSGPGSELDASYEHSFTLQIFNTAGGSWSVTVRSVGSADWDPSLQLAVKVAGGSYQIVTALDEPFTTGMGDDSVSALLIVTGVSLSLAPGACYTTSVVYTVQPQ